jgi:hypothetical protein
MTDNEKKRRSDQLEANRQRELEPDESSSTEGCAQREDIIREAANKCIDAAIIEAGRAPLTAPAPLTDRVAELARKLVEANPHIIKDYFVDGEPVGEQLAEAVKLMGAALAPITTSETSILELAHLFDDARESGRPITLSAESCAALYAAMTTRLAAPAPLTDELPAILFQGHAVHSEITRHLGRGHCFTPDAVSTTLDAVVRLMRAERKSAAPAPQQSELTGEQWIFDLAAEHEANRNGLYGPVTFDATGLVDFARAIEREVAKAAPAAPVQTAALEILQKIIDVADAEPECVTEAMWKRIADAKAVLKGNAVQAEQAQAEPIGEVGTMPGTDGFTMACFKASEVPVGTKLYLATPALPAQAEQVEAVRAAEPESLNGIPATMTHDEGAIARCFYCGRYSLDPATIGADSRQPVCECGKQHGWSGSFKKPGPDAKWSGKAPEVLATKEAAAQVPTAEPKTEAQARAEFEKWAEPRGYSMERTTDSYKSQGTKSAWRGWWACERFAAPSTTPSNDTSALGNTGGAK